ncbi:photosystem II protein PsbQ [Pseudanabaena sp. PCC 6802]|uniref:photosystem II protein PsbQ n=1 Tax=Pseudanabaena sp. PCC 6802 TaxID=118173 RepID=UPI0003476478|nr:photosystem II protein PsbQ [Pseudanabaena sp. PCC 6802]
MLNLFNWKPLKRIAIALSLVLCIFISGVYAPSAIAQTSQPDSYLAKVEALSSSLDRLEAYIAKDSWSDITGLIHGPLGEIRSDVSRLIRALPRKAQSSAKALAKKLFDDLVALDFAVSNRNESSTRSIYAQIRKDYQGILDLFANS